ncbi:MAG: hypothetical protein V7K50_14325 [Nostoc sp.]
MDAFTSDRSYIQHYVYILLLNAQGVVQHIIVNANGSIKNGEVS